MKKIAWCLLLLLSGSGFALAQDAPSSYRVKGGEDAAKVIPNQIKYRYPSFQKGKVVYINGSSSPAMINYNFLLEEMQFIDPKGDTMSMAGGPTIQSVLVGESTYLYNTQEGFLEVVADNSRVKLGKRQKLGFAGAEKVGAYNQSSGASSIRNTSTYVDANSKGYKLVQKGDVLFTEKVDYLLVDQNNLFYKVNKANLLRLFPAHKKEILGYLKEHSPDLNDEEDLKELLRFCNGLEA
ncbi:hypothetical protein GCM10023188_12800 [Pontibacter saemangeumensis]|uniref:FecR family protein n=1 Tax=Pontibacter saemangeumensis TaxID=1084525 RepID=A0ABP8LFS9_9BACT